VVEFLVKQYPESADEAGKDSKTPIDIASKMGNKNVLKILMDDFLEAVKQPPTKSIPLHILCRNKSSQHLECLKYLIDKISANVNQKVLKKGEGVPMLELGFVHTGPGFFLEVTYQIIALFYCLNISKQH